MTARLKNKKGFTLIEILIVIIVLGILAMIIVPQITVSTDDAKVSTLQTSLGALRSALEIYYAQHGNKYPGQTNSAGAANASDAGVAATAMVAQLTRYTDGNGAVNSSKNTTYKYGPYIKGGELPKNPFNSLTSVVCNNTTDITTTRTPDATKGWKFHFNTGVLYAADTTAHAAY